MARFFCSALLSLAAASVAPLIASSARADGLADIEGLLEEPVVSSVSKAAETRASAPATSTTITADDLRRYGIRSLDEAINYLSLGMFTQDPLYTVDIGARGVMLSGDYGNHVLLLVDGHTLNEVSAGGAYFDRGAGVPMELVDHIEVITGPGSVLYGSSAVLGVINVVTKRASAYAGPRLIVEGQLPTGFRVGAGIGRELKLFGQRSELVAQVEYFGSKGPSFSFGPQRYGLDAVTGRPKQLNAIGPAEGIWGGFPSNALYKQVPTGYVRLDVGDFELALRATMFRRADAYYNYVSTYPIAYGDPDSFTMDRWLSFDLKHRAALSSYVTLASRLYGDLYHYDQLAVSFAAEDCLPGQLRGCRRDFTIHARWIGLEERVAVDWLRDGKLVTTLGVEGRLRAAGSGDDISDRVTGKLGERASLYDAREKAAAVYLQQTLQATKWLGFNAGGRVDIDDRYGSKLSPRAAIITNPWPGATVKVVYAEAFRAPSLYESFNADPTVQVRAERLKPEGVRSIEVTFEQRIGAHRFHVGGFRSWYTDLVSLVALSDAELRGAIASGQLAADATYASQIRNVNSIDVVGFQAALEGTSFVGRLRYGLDVTGALARQKAPYEAPLPPTLAPSLFTNARLAYHHGGAIPEVAIAGWIASSRPADRAYDGGFTPAPYAPPQIEARLSASGPLPFAKGLGYRVMGSVATASKSPYVVGAAQYALPEARSAELAPVIQFKAGATLEYAIPL